MGGWENTSPGENIIPVTVTSENLTPPAAGEAAEPSARGGREYRLHRRLDRALIGGVCAGFADYVEVEPLVVRVAFIVLAVASGGFGLVLYPVVWALVPAEAPSPDASPWRSRLSGWREASAIGVLVVGAIIVVRHAGLWLGDDVVLPLVLASCGLALILRQGGAKEWVPGDALAGGRAGAARVGRWRHWPRVLAGVALILGAAVLGLNRTGVSHKSLGGMLVIVVALGLVFAPSFLRLARSLATEREERIRSQERAEVAAHLHDSVLQTLALIQRRADDPREVAGLARSQERELRRWLFERDYHPAADTFARALEQAATEVEANHRVQIEVVTVGDCPLDERLEAMTAAAREALVNAAKFAGEDRIDLYAEVGAERAQVFVRDRGVGFDPAAIPPDRCGVRQSIVERMRRHGGHAEIISEPGRGAEIELAMERG
jgi:signal transduction histidine kinase/phage shock protein PspC (stress-responsive transcriptional regulator)